MVKELLNPNIDDFTKKYAEIGSWVKLANYYGVSKETIKKFANKIGLDSKKIKEISIKMICLTD